MYRCIFILNLPNYDFLSSFFTDKEMEMSWFVKYGCNLRVSSSVRMLLLALLTLSTFFLLLQSVYLHGNSVSKIAKSM